MLKGGKCKVVDNLSLTAFGELVTVAKLKKCNVKPPIT